MNESIKQINGLLIQAIIAVTQGGGRFPNNELSF